MTTTEGRRELTVGMGAGGLATADMVLLDDDLGAIVSTVREGRRIYRNLVSVVGYLVSGNLSEIGVIVDDVQKRVAELKAKGVNVSLLTKAKLRDGNNGASLADLTAHQRNRVLTQTPLWFYVLREAELNNGKLKGVGARIVAETFHRAMEGSTHSIVRDPAWRPSLGVAGEVHRHLLRELSVGQGRHDIPAEDQRSSQSRDERVLRPLRLQRIGERILRGGDVLVGTEHIAQGIVRVLEMLRDIADGLLGRSRLVGVLLGGDGVERSE